MSKSSSNSKKVEGTEEDSVVYRDGFNWLKTEQLRPNPWNPNVMDHPTIQMLKVNLQEEKYDPLIVVKARIFFSDHENYDSNEYIIVDGEQRWRAARELETVWLKVDIVLLKESEAKAECYSRGKVRGQLDPIKEGQLFDLELEELGSEAAVAEKYRVSRSYIAGRRSLTRVPDVVKLMLREPEKAFVAIKEAEIAANIVESNPEEEYTKRQMEEMVATTMEQDDIVPRGTLTASHLEAIAGRPETAQTSTAAKIVEENLTVRDTETVVKLVKERIEREKRFEAALERAVQKVCPDCGGAPKGFDTAGYNYSSPERTPLFNEDKFECSESSWHDWDYMEDRSKAIAKKEKRALEANKERSANLVAARQNPAYLRRAEDVNNLYESMRPWVLRKIQQFEKITRVSITGVRADGRVMRIDSPLGFGLSLYFSTSGGTKDGTLDWKRKDFSFSMEKKEYKKLPFNTKLNCTATPEYRASVHRFLDEIIHTDEDPFLPEAPEEVKAILIKYGEAEPEPTVDVCPICGAIESECTCLAIEKGAYERAGSEGEEEKET